ncbi:MarR family transcriptional regulator [Pseudomonas sp. No.21]|jgi:DNA-binding MarR family transcriptional regulator|uniref:MarR family transcriptional regulator n=2 Tax=Pseudomonas TaxID=286 RepID=A0AAU7XYK7_9PSED|nr:MULTISPECIES: MarR family transcriptional regulator [Pseudomonas]EQM71512.1 MarR family transcriptional regulator [Pseudomonas alcaligenes OT 69]MBB4819344.1 DNA-binding MarR family transcriptional regulator [Pseudomonas alcaligenes]MCU9950951.1 MarR family transcriptional regulator [Pseudomonas sp. PDM13]MDN4145045.1 MarR family transcriptional regulator [Pseudomonas tohonis]MDU9413136.1 MarR family transcriptional regulator [Pseudomonas sp. zfem005]
MTTPKKRQSRYNPASDNFRKEDFPFYWLARVHGRYSMAMEKALKKIDMDIPRWRILFILKENGESSISEISEHAIAKLSTVTKIVYRMKADGLVDTNPCSNDGRVTQVSITEAGRRTAEQIQVTTAHIFTNSFKDLSEAQITKLNGTLEKIFNNLPED